jgi:hypothetical protein
LLGLVVDEDGIVEVDVELVDVDADVEVDGADSCVGCCSNVYFQKLLLLIGNTTFTPFRGF